MQRLMILLSLRANWWASGTGHGSGSSDEQRCSRQLRLASSR